ncbi:hypothetical protein QMK33_16620 [Hymenobacter sp. H14-R3]|uniref:hypothetical protein n=1 Tax=Hymenobacter sp. H14-R3 TaxID=3046308 RepID=UPI0024BB0C08|nr:hypothetical protein [Hymenobacter sp. H14-R3]MDJ0366779.1 hypothetical protein [Hymenobacter sp. H14-R3]
MQAPQAIAQTTWRGLLALLLGLAACQPQPDAAQAVAAAPPTGHFAGTVQVAGRPALRAALEVRHPRPGHYSAELVLPEQPALSFVADSLTFVSDTLRLARPGQPGQALALGRQGDFWRGTLLLDSVRYPVLLVRRGEPEPAVYQVRRDEVAGTHGPALLFSPADESLPGLALAFFPTRASAPAAPAWADALARQGHTVLLLPPADTLAAPALANALALLRRTAGVDTARVGAWVGGWAAGQLPLLLAESPAARPAFVVVQDAPSPPLATRAAWRELAQGGQLLAIYDPAQPRAAVAALRTAVGAQRVRQAPTASLQSQVIDWLRER